MDREQMEARKDMAKHYLYCAEDSESRGNPSTFGLDILRAEISNIEDAETAKYVLGRFHKLTRECVDQDNVNAAKRLIAKIADGR